jgi:hypothetical protein
MQDRVKGPAIGLIVLGGLGVIFAIIGLLANGMLLDMYKSVLPPDQYQQVEGALKANTVVRLAFSIFAVFVSAFVLYGGIQMMNLRNRSLVMIAAVVAMVPCIGPCCLIGVPVGIWALVLLSKPEVKAAFTS